MLQFAIENGYDNQEETDFNLINEYLTHFGEMCAKIFYLSIYKYFIIIFS